jgi:putative flippase GtrA
VRTIVELVRLPLSRLMGRGIRFVIAGGAVMLLYIAVTMILAGVGVAFQAALVVGFVSALAAHFALQRAFVWVHAEGYALPLSQQAGRYLLVAATQYGATSSATLFLPDLMGVGVTYVYLPTVVAITVVNFIVFGTRVFHPAETP